jgi:hypothetical protein
MEKPTFFLKKNKVMSMSSFVSFFVSPPLRTPFSFFEIQEKLAGPFYQNSRHIYADAHRGLWARMTLHPLIGCRQYV